MLSKFFLFFVILSPITTLRTTVQPTTCFTTMLFGPQKSATFPNALPLQKLNQPQTPLLNTTNLLRYLIRAQTLAFEKLSSRSSCRSPSQLQSQLQFGFGCAHRNPAPHAAALNLLRAHHQSVLQCAHCSPATLAVASNPLRPQLHSLLRLKVCTPQLHFTNLPVDAHTAALLRTPQPSTRCVHNVAAVRIQFVGAYDDLQPRSPQLAA